MVQADRFLNRGKIPYVEVALQGLIQSEDRSAHNERLTRTRMQSGEVEMVFMQETAQRFGLYQTIFGNKRVGTLMPREP